MANKFRCPVCGHLINRSNLNKDFKLEVFDQHGLGYGRGFKYDKANDPFLVELVKSKIRSLYQRFLGEMEFLSRPSISVRTKPLARVHVHPRLEVIR